MAEATTSSAAASLTRVADTLARFISKHWLAVINTGVGVFTALPILAPFLMQAGYHRAASWIYSAYRFTCHQLPQRSYFIGGEDFSYPFSRISQVAGVANFYDLYHQPITELPLGFQVAVCHRDVAIYGSIFLAGLLFALVRDHVRPLPIKAYVLVVIVPLALDGFTQLFGLRESTWLLRTVTGVLFGAGSVWLAYPYLEQGMNEAREELS